MSGGNGSSDASVGGVDTTSDGVVGTALGDGVAVRMRVAAAFGAMGSCVVVVVVV